MDETVVETPTVLEALVEHIAHDQDERDAQENARRLTVLKAARRELLVSSARASFSALGEERRREVLARRWMTGAESETGTALAKREPLTALLFAYARHLDLQVALPAESITNLIGGAPMDAAASTLEALTAHIPLPLRSLQQTRGLPLTRSELDVAIKCGDVEVYCNEGWFTTVFDVHRSREPDPVASLLRETAIRNNERRSIQLDLMRSVAGLEEE